MADAGGERWVGLATDFSEGSRAALRWAAVNLLRAGDQLLLLHVIKEADYEQSEAILWESTGSRTLPPPPMTPSPPPTRPCFACQRASCSWSFVACRAKLGISSRAKVGSFTGFDGPYPALRV